MANESEDYLEQAAVYWRAGQTHQAGKLIFENLPPEARPRWAAGILKLLVERTGITSKPIEHILRVANDQRQWSQAHDAFSGARAVVLKLDKLREKRSPEQTLLLGLLGVAELVAKVTYNATNPEDEFDEDSGWWIPACARNVLSLLGDVQFAETMWSKLCSAGGKGPHIH
jgi:hypothetical protein